MAKKPHTLGALFSSPLGPFSDLDPDTAATQAPGTVPTGVVDTWSALRYALGHGAPRNINAANLRARNMLKVVK